MVKIRWKLTATPNRLWLSLKNQWRRLHITMNSLFYNHHTNSSYIVDVLMEPIFWFVENFTKVLGPFFVFGVCGLTSSVVCIAYWIGLPYWWDKSPFATVLLLLFGHWLLVNVCFHYYMATVTLPGQPPEGILIPEAASMCRKCIAPRPPRAHHCSICNKCIIKMDHHCPWLDNCVGHYNHRYFFLYMVYTCLGVLFLIIFGVEIAYKEVWLEPEEEEALIGHPVRFNNSVMIAVPEVPFENETEEPQDASRIQRRCIIYMAFICTGVLVALGSLTSWHALLITHGETSIETLINKGEKKRETSLNAPYLNPYDFGARRNWRLFLGMVDGRGWLHVLLPSAHKPVGNGLTWTTIYSEREAELQTVEQHKPEPVVFEFVKRRKPSEEKRDVNADGDRFFDAS